MPKTLPYQRKKEGKTDYLKRLNLLKSKKPRLVIRKSLNHILLQITEYHESGDQILTSAHSRQLKKLGWKHHCGNLSAAYLTGLICGLKAQAQNLREAVLDTGLAPSIKGSVIYSALKGVLDSGLSVPHSRAVLPADAQLSSKSDFNVLKEHILKEKW